MKTIHLNLSKKWFDMIKSGKKKEEYREIKPYYISMFFDWKESNQVRDNFIIDLLLQGEQSNLWVYLKDLSDIIIFENGYKKLIERPRFEAQFDSITVGYGKPEWGAEPGKKYFILKLS